MDQMPHDAHRKATRPDSWPSRCQEVEESSCTSLHLIQSNVRFSKVAPRTATSIVLLTILLAGIIAPTGVCALMCERHSRVETQRHCSQSSDTMPGMGHGHSAMNHQGFADMRLVIVSYSCQLNCVTAERLDASRRAMPQVTEVESDPVALDTAAEFAPPDHGATWSSDNSPPYSPSASTASFSVLRI